MAGFLPTAARHAALAVALLAGVAFAGPRPSLNHNATIAKHSASSSGLAPKAPRRLRANDSAPVRSSQRQPAVVLAQDVESAEDDLARAMKRVSRVEKLLAKGAAPGPAPAFSPVGAAPANAVLPPCQPGPNHVPCTMHPPQQQPPPGFAASVPAPAPGPAPGLMYAPAPGAMFAPWSFPSPLTTADVPPRTFKQAFEDMDTNNNGVVEPYEAANASMQSRDVGLHKNFNSVDANADGVITWEEADLNNMVHVLDTNNDGVLSKDEVFERVVTFAFVLEHVDYELLKASEKIEAQLVDGVKGAIVAVGGYIFAADDVDINLSPGSVHLDAQINPPGNMSVGHIANTMNASNNLEAAVAAAVAGIGGLTALITGGGNMTDLIPVIHLYEPVEIETSDELNELAEEAGFTPDFLSKDVNGDGVLTWNEVKKELLPTKDICGCTPQVKAECTCDGSLQFLACVEQNCPGQANEQCARLSAEDWCGAEMTLGCNGAQSTCEGKYHQLPDGLVGLKLIENGVHFGDSVYCGPHGKCLGKLKIEVEVHKSYALPNDGEGSTMECELDGGGSTLAKVEGIEADLPKEGELGKLPDIPTALLQGSTKAQCTGPVEPGWEDEFKRWEGTAECEVSMVHSLGVGDKLKGACWIQTGDARITGDALFFVENDHKAWDGQTGLSIFPSSAPSAHHGLWVLLVLAATAVLA